MSVFGWYYGDFDDGQLVWLVGILFELVLYGIFFVMYYLLLFSYFLFFDILELCYQDEFVEVICGIDVCGIFVGYLYYFLNGMFVGVLVSVVLVICYMMNVVWFFVEVNGMDVVQVFQLVYVYFDMIMYMVVLVVDVFIGDFFLEEWLECMVKFILEV